MRKGLKLAGVKRVAREELGQKFLWAALALSLAQTTSRRLREGAVTQAHPHPVGTGWLALLQPICPLRVGWVPESWHPEAGIVSASPDGCQVCCRWREAGDPRESLPWRGLHGN